MVQRPISAFVSSLWMLGQDVQEGQRLDAIVSRIVHTLSRAPVYSRPETRAVFASDTKWIDTSAARDVIQPELFSSEPDRTGIEAADPAKRKTRSI